MKWQISGVELELVQGDIAVQDDVTAVVNAANAQLRMGGGVAGAIHREAGPALEKETRSLAPLQPGEAVITGGHNLPNDYVIHVLGPVYGQDEPASELLSNCYRRALELAEENEIESIAFPAVSTGAFGYPKKEAAAIACRTVLETISELDHVILVRFVLFSTNDLEIHEKVFKEIID